MSQILNMELGERRRVYLEISLGTSEPFTIRNPVYELTVGDTVEATGKCEIQDEHTLICLIEPKKRAYYNLIYTMEIAGEVIKQKVLVYVT